MYRDEVCCHLTVRILIMSDRSEDIVLVSFVFRAFVVLCDVHCLIIKPLSVCSPRRGLSNRQVKLCNKYRDHMEFIVDGTKMALDECSNQFKDRRWNCTFPLEHKRGFVPFLPRGMSYSI